MKDPLPRLSIPGATVERVVPASAAAVEVRRLIVSERFRYVNFAAGVLPGQLS